MKKKNIPVSKVFMGLLLCSEMLRNASIARKNLRHASIVSSKSRFVRILHRRIEKSVFFLNSRILIHPLHGPPFAGRASNSNWQSNKLGCYITMYSPIARSVVLRRRNRTIIDLLGNVFIHNAARSRVSRKWRYRAKSEYWDMPIFTNQTSFSEALENTSEERQRKYLIETHL